jgi:hypothetical protein
VSAPLEPVNSELVAVAWAQALPGVSPNTVATVLPDLAKWAATGFITVDNVVGGTPHPDIPERRPVIQYSCWAAREGSGTRPPWGRAFILAERLVRCTEADSAYRSLVVAPHPAFEQATVHDATALVETRRFPVPDLAGFARVTVDIQLIWTRLTSPEVHT